MILAIKKYPDSILRKKCQEIEELTEEIKKLGQDMLETMIANQGIGLAAPQVGVSKRIIVVQPILEEGIEKDAIQDPQIFINPKIIRKSRKTLIDEEGCLSLPGLFLEIKRAQEIEVEALNERGEKISLMAKGLTARIFQHEIDHLDGILFFDRLGFWQRLKLKRRLKEYESH